MSMRNDQIKMLFQGKRIRWSLLKLVDLEKMDAKIRVLSLSETSQRTKRRNERNAETNRVQRICNFLNVELEILGIFKKN